MVGAASPVRTAEAPVALKLDQGSTLLQRSAIAQRPGLHIHMPIIPIAICTTCCKVLPLLALQLPQRPEATLSQAGWVGGAVSDLCGRISGLGDEPYGAGHKQVADNI